MLVWITPLRWINSSTVVYIARQGLYCNMNSALQFITVTISSWAVQKNLLANSRHSVLQLNVTLSNITLLY